MHLHSHSSKSLLPPSSPSHHMHHPTTSLLHVPCSLRLLPLIFAFALLLSVLNFVLRLHLRHAHHRLSLNDSRLVGRDEGRRARLPDGVDVANNINAATIIAGERGDTRRQARIPTAKTRLQQERQTLDAFPPSFDRPAHCVAVVPRRLDRADHPSSLTSTSTSDDFDDDDFNKISSSKGDFASRKPRFNTRSFCLFSATCILPRTQIAPSRLFLSGSSTSSDSPSTTTCRTTSPTLVDRNNKTTNVTARDCARLRKSVMCAHGLYSGALTATCADTGESLSRAGYDTLTRRFADEKNGEGVENDRGTDVEMSNGMMLRNVTLLHGVVVVVPAYHYMGNIYHYSHAIATATHVITTLQPLLSHWPSSSSSSGITFPSSSNNNNARTVTLLFRGNFPQGYGAWQHAVTSAVVEQHFRHRLNISLSVHTLYEDEFTKFSPLRLTLRADGIGRGNGVCMQSAVLLGRRGTPNIWPFASYDVLKSRLEPIVERVPVSALQLRAAVYAAHADVLRERSVMDVDALLSGTSGLGHEEEGEWEGEMKVKDLPDELLLDMPKAAIGYARRNGPDDDEMGNTDHAFEDDDDDESTYINGTARRFSKRDESWLLNMLHEEALNASTSSTDPITVTTLQTPSSVTFSSQLQRFFDVGVVVGIHGANLLNTLFTPTFSSLVEISAIQMQCYVYGANSGLSYWVYESKLKASAKQSRCGPGHYMCLKSRNHRRVMIETEEDRREIRMRVRMAIERIMELRRRFEHLGGIPTVLDRERAEYRIDWTKARPSA